MTLRFVKTSVLVSEDGLDFSKETAVESEEARAARLARESAANKPLYQQLADIKQRKQDEYDANTKLLFSAPKALDEDEYYFLESLKDSQASAERLNKEEEEKALEQFRIARKLQKEDGIVSQSQPKVVLKADKSNSSSLSLGSSSVSTVRGKRLNFTVELLFYFIFYLFTFFFNRFFLQLFDI